MKRLKTQRNSIFIIDLERPLSRNHYLKKCFQTLLMTSALLAATSAAAQAPQPIEWELVNPFRFIHDRETIDKLREAYAALPADKKTAAALPADKKTAAALPADKKTAAALERRLQDQSEFEITQRREAARGKYDCKNTKSAEERRQCFEPYAGWFAKVAKDNHDLTCWDSELRKFRTKGPCEDYIYPTKHRVRVWITNPETFGTSIPQWTVQPATETKACDAKYEKRFCIEFEVTYPEQSHVVAQFPGATPLDRNIKVEDRLIVGLGDSFAAGEGNPDIPAQFIDSDRNHDVDSLSAWFAGNSKAEFPKKDDYTEAAWLDLRCHRSMYSYQFKTALQLALSNPQEAITYVTFSCSGAVTPEIIDKKQAAKERGSSLKPQLKALREVLQNGKKPTREIDYLLLSTGGNDIGFAKYVTFILLGHNWFVRFAKNVNAEKIERDYKKKEIEKKLWGNAKSRGNYRLLHKALGDAASTEPPRRISIKGCEPHKPCERILLTPYPNVFTDKDGLPCEGNRLEFDDAFGPDPARAKKIELVKRTVFEELQKLQAHPGIRSELGWTVVDRNVALYFKHGFCAFDATSPSIGEKFQIPTWVNKEWTNNFNPRDYRGYQSRVRWFRLPVDSKLITDQQHNLPFGGKLDLFYEDVSSNVMHPTAEGLAETADANVAAIRKIESRAN